MIAAPYRLCVLAFVFLAITIGLAQAQVVVQQNPSLVIVKPNPVAAITGALLAPVSQNANPSVPQVNNNVAPSAGPAPYPSANGACQPGYVFDGHGYCIVPYNAPNNIAPTSNNPSPYNAQACQPGYVPDGRGSCMVPYPDPNMAASPTSGPVPYAPVACANGYVLNAQGTCVPPNIPQNQQPMPQPVAAQPTTTAPVPAAEDTSGACPTGYALDHDGNCSFASETSPYQK